MCTILDEISSAGGIPLVPGGSSPRRSGGLEPDQGSHRIITVVAPAKAVDALLGLDRLEAPARDILERLRDSQGGIVRVAYASNLEVDSLRRVAREAAERARAVGQPHLMKAAYQVIKNIEAVDGSMSREG